MADFAIALSKTSINEGKYANDPKDKGGETYRGIARKMHPEWIGWHTIDKVKETNITTAEINATLDTVSEMPQMIIDFFKKNFWDIYRLDEIHSQAIANKVYDIGVNCGVPFAATSLQRVLNALNRRNPLDPASIGDWTDIIVDGKVGSKTIAIVNVASLSRTQNILIYLGSLRGSRDIDLAERPDGYGKRYINGWGPRVYS